MKSSVSQLERPVMTIIFSTQRALSGFFLATVLFQFVARHTQRSGQSQAELFNGDYLTLIILRLEPGPSLLRINQSMMHPMAFVLSCLVLSCLIQVIMITITTMKRPWLRLRLRLCMDINNLRSEVRCRDGSGSGSGSRS